MKPISTNSNELSLLILLGNFVVSSDWKEKRSIIICIMALQDCHHIRKIRENWGYYVPFGSMKRKRSIFEKSGKM